MIGFSKRAWLDNVVVASDGRWPAPLQLMLRVLEVKHGVLSMIQLFAKDSRVARLDSRARQHLSDSLSRGFLVPSRRLRFGAVASMLLAITFLGCARNSGYEWLNPPDDAGVFTYVDAGYFRDCGVLDSGKIYCWYSGGRDSSPPSGNVISLSTSWGSCAVYEDNHIFCWDMDEYSYGEEHAVDTPDGEFIAVDVGKMHSCGLTTLNEIECWFDGGVSSPFDGTYTQVSAGYGNHICAISTDVNIHCTGDDNDGQSTPPEGQFTPWLHNQ